MNLVSYMSLKKSELIDFKNIIKNNEMEEEQIKREFLLQKIKKIWPEVIGPMFVNHTELVGFYSGKLVIHVSHSSYKQEILINQRQILKGLNQLLNRNGQITELQIKTGNIKKYLNQNPEKKLNKNPDLDTEKFNLNENDEKIRKKMIEMIQAIDP